MTILAILQARMSSSRLPGKVLRPIVGRPMLGRHIDRLKRSQRIDRLVVATSTESSDDPIASFCVGEGLICFRGSLDDVLGRFEAAASASDPVDQIVRLTGDCPLADPAVIDRLIDLHLFGGYDYSSNVREFTFPDGLDAEIMTRQTLREAAREAVDPYEREHVTPFIYRRPERYRLGSLTNNAVLGHLRWTVDTEADFRMVEAVFGALLRQDGFFGYLDVLAFLTANPDIAAINAPGGKGTAATTQE